MKVLSVEVTNFKSYYGTHFFPLADRGLTLIMGDNQDEPRMDSNGAGKSTMVSEALDWCWWGVIPSGDHAESLFNEEAFLERGAKSQVVTRLETDQGEPVTITRWRTKSKYELQLQVGDRVWDTLDVDETQKEVNRVLGLDYEVGHAAILFGQNDLVHYADAKDAARMKILTKIVQLGGIDQYQEGAKAKLKVNADKKVKLQADLASVDGQLQSNRPEDLDALIAQWEQDHKETLARYQGLLTTKAAEHHQATTEAIDPAAMQAQKVALDQELAGMQPPVVDPEYPQAERDVHQGHTEYEVATLGLEDLQARLGKLQILGEGLCSECGQPITAQHLQTEVYKLQESLRGAGVAQSAGEARWKAAGERWAAAKQRGETALSVHQATREQKLQESTQLGAQLRVAAQQTSRVLILAQEMKGLQAQLLGAQSAGNPLVERKAQMEKERYDLERRQGQIRYEIEALEVDARYLDFWVEGFGAQGLKSYILDTRLQELSDAANEWLLLLTSGTIWVRFEAQKQTRGKKLVNAPDVRVFRWNPDGTTTERNYKSWSGGEKKRISFCVDFGLSRLVARRATQTYDLLILDEVFKHLDQAGKEAVMEMLQLLGQEKSSLLVVEHDTEFQGQFDHRVMVRKKNRRSTIEESHVHQKTEAQEGVSSDLPVNPDRKRIPVRTPVRRPVG